MIKHNHIYMEYRSGHIVFDYKDVILFNISIDDSKYMLKQISGNDDTGYLDLDVNNNIIIDGVDEL